MGRRIGLLGIVVAVVVVGFGAWWLANGAGVSTSGTPGAAPTSGAASTSGPTSASGTADTSGFHIVDGYWLGPETACTDPKSPVTCASAIATATPIIKAQHPDAQILGATVAEPNCSGTTLSPCTDAGLYKGLFVVFGLSDGSRQIVSLICEASGPTSQEPDCRPYPLINQG